MKKQEKFAVLKINNAQYKVAEGEEILIQKISGKPGDKLTYEEVLLTADGDKVQVGTPLVAKASVKAELIEQTKGPKVRKNTYKSKSRYRKAKGHRQPLTKIKITKIT